MSYDANNVFAKILRGEIPCKKIHEDTHTLAFHDVSPKVPTHVLVIPKGAYTSMDDLAANGSDQEIAALFRAVAKVARDTGIADEGYRILVNCGTNGGQEVPHLHVHVLGGRHLGPMIM